MLLGQSSPLRGDLVGGEMPAPDEVTAVVGGCTNWLRDEANCRRVGAAGTGEALSCGERLVAVHQLRRERRLNRLAEWLAERARLVGSLVGLTDEQFNAETAPGQWTYRVIAKHVLALEQDSLKTLAADIAARGGAEGLAAP